jgi:integrase
VRNSQHTTRSSPRTARIRQFGAMATVPTKMISPESIRLHLAPEHYIFPACESGRIDPFRPQKTWRTAWRRLTKKAGLAGLRFHDLRHTAITVLAESQSSEQTIMALAGHVSRQMLEHYSHIRLEAKRRAVAALALPRLPLQKDAVDGALEPVTAQSTPQRLLAASN